MTTNRFAVTSTTRGVQLGAGGEAVATAANAAAVRAAAGVYSTAEVDTSLALVAGGVAAKPNVQAATTGAIADLSAVTLASVFSGYVPVAGDRVLVKDNASPDGVAAVSAVHNGWYLVGTVNTGVAALARVSDANASAEFYGVTTCIVARGSLAGAQYKTAQAMSFVLGTDPIVFTEIPSTPAGGAETEVLTIVGGVPAWAPAASGATHSTGTLAARSGLTPAAGDSYRVTSGVATGDVYLYLGGAWRLVAFSRRRLDETPYHWWKLDDASGGAVDSGSGATDLAEAGSAGGLTYDVPLPVGRGARFSGSSGLLRFQGAVGAGMALTTAATVAFWARLDSIAVQQTFVACETNQGSNAQPYGTLMLTAQAGTIRGWCTTTSFGDGQSTTGGNVAVGADHLIGLTFESSTLTIWQDGAPVASLSTTGGTLFTAGASQRWTIGELAGPGERAAGRVSDVRVYDTAKAASWWAETFERGVGAYRGQ